MQNKNHLTALLGKMQTVRAKVNIALAGVIFTPAVASASSTSEFDFLTTQKDGGMFSGAMQIVEDGGAGLYATAKKGAIVWLMFAFILTGLMFTSSNSTKVQAAKERFGWVIAGAILVFGGMGALGLASSIGDAFAGMKFGV